LSADRSPRRNRLQSAREEYEARAGNEAQSDTRAGNEARAELPLIDLVDGSFHRAGFRFPPAILQREFERYLAGPGYRPVAAGAPAARAAIAAYYSRGRDGAGSTAIAPNNIILTASSSESYRLLFDQLCGPGDSVLLPCPGYPLFEHLAEHSRIKPEFYELHPEDAWLPDPSALERVMASRPGARAIVLISPNNPSGAVMEPARLEAIRTVSARHGMVVILDEVFREFVYETAAPGQQLVSAAESAPQAAATKGTGALLVRINGISKMFACPDIKLGWIVVEASSAHSAAGDELLQRLEIAADVYLSASGPAQHLAPALFAEGMGFVADMRGELARRRAVLLEELAAIGGLSYIAPAGGIHCIVEVPGLSVDDEELAVRAVREEGLYVHPGYLYGIHNRTTLVLSFLSHPDQIRAGLARLRRVLRRL